MTGASRFNESSRIVGSPLSIKCVKRFPILDTRSVLTLTRRNRAYIPPVRWSHEIISFTLTALCIFFHYQSAITTWLGTSSSHTEFTSTADSGFCFAGRGKLHLMIPKWQFIVQHLAGNVDCNASSLLVAANQVFGASPASMSDRKKSNSLRSHRIFA